MHKNPGNIGVHGGNPWGVAAQFGGSPDDYLDFSANINPLGPPSSVLRAIEDALSEIRRYPEPSYANLTEAIAERYSVDTGQIVVGNGATEIIYRLSGLREVRRWLIPQPTFGEYNTAAVRMGISAVNPVTPLARLSHVQPLAAQAGDQFSEALYETVSEYLCPGDLLFLCNPNNPTGELLSGSFVVRMAQYCQERGAYLVVDESFLDFVPGVSSSVSLIDQYKNVLFLISLTKMYAIPGLRLGCLIASADIAERLRNTCPSWSVNALAAAAGVAAVKDAEFAYKTQEFVETAKRHLVGRLHQIDTIRVLPGAANFLLLDVAGTGLSSGQVKDALIRHRVIVRDCSTFPGLAERFLRVAVKLPEENERLAATFEEVCGYQRGEGQSHARD